MSKKLPRDIENLASEAGMRMTDQRRVIARVLSDAQDHPDVEEVYKRAAAEDDAISIATVYRTVRLFEEAGILTRHDFGDGRARYEPSPEDHHDHLIDIQSGKVIEFTNNEIERLQKEVAEKLGYRLVDHRLELYAVPLDAKTRK
ncbi:MAG TPA: transcriptional repressor [Rhodobiaceae bacterium]|nr:transcriptional repressor [Rhodobiaceae bacterium]|tara:strand:+ start:916 stop:1350 length:435 start_codon:yes stop_codon:yes gene_type:complete